MGSGGPGSWEESVGLEPEVGSGRPRNWEGSVGLKGQVGLLLGLLRCPGVWQGLGPGPSAGARQNHTSPQSALGQCPWAQSTALLQGARLGWVRSSCGLGAESGETGVQPTQL